MHFEEKFNGRNRIFMKKIGKRCFYCDVGSFRTPTTIKIMAILLFLKKFVKIFVMFFKVLKLDNFIIEVFDTIIENFPSFVGPPPRTPIVAC